MPQKVNNLRKFLASRFHYFNKSNNNNNNVVKSCFYEIKDFGEADFILWVFIRFKATNEIHDKFEWFHMHEYNVKMIALKML